MKFPTAGLAQLNKTLLRVRGPDASHFLNGIVTSRMMPTVVKKKQLTIGTDDERNHVAVNPEENWGLLHEDIYDPDKTIFVRRDAVASMFLNLKGRVMNDCFLYSYPFHEKSEPKDSSDLDPFAVPQYVVEVDPRFVGPLQMMLRLHKLSARVEVLPDKSLRSYYFYNDSEQFDLWLEELQHQFFTTKSSQDALASANEFMALGAVFSASAAPSVVGFGFDNRIPNFGVKIITSGAVDPRQLFSDSFRAQFWAEPSTGTSPEIISSRRFLNGLYEAADGPKDVSVLPFEMNLDYTNGLSLDKGCYVGQELTIRTFTNGIIRKRIFPVQFFLMEDKESVEGQHLLELNPSDAVISALSGVNLLKLDVTPLKEVEEAPAPENSAPSPFGSKPVRKRKSSSGKIYAANENLGFVLMALADYEKCQFYKVEIPGLDGNKTVGLRVFRPDWWPEE